MKKAFYLGAPWCAQCRLMQPKFENECKRLGVLYEVLNVDDNPEIVAAYVIRNVPTILFMDDGKIIDRGVAADMIPKLSTLK